MLLFRETDAAKESFGLEIVDKLNSEYLGRAE